MVPLDGEERTRLSQTRMVIQKEGRGYVSWLRRGISPLFRVLCADTYDFLLCPESLGGVYF